MTAQQEFLDAIKDIDAAVPDTESLTLPGVGEICDLIGTIKVPLRTVVIPFLKALGGYAAVVAKVLEKLLALAEQVCPK